MSQDFLAVAQIQIAANATAFRAELAKLRTEAAAIKPIVIPVRAQVGSTASRRTASALAAEAAAAEGTAAAANTAAAGNEKLAASSKTAAVSLDAEAAAARKAGASVGNLAKDEAAASAAQRRSAARRNEALRGIQAQTFSFAGLRGAIIGANSAFLAATAGVIALGAAIKSAASFETQLNVFQATAGATADQMERVGKAARDLGADVTLPAVSAGDAAEAMTELAKAGLSVEDALGGARGVLQLATAAAIDNAAATELAASAINAFGLAGSEATHVADVLTNAANSSQGSISDMGVALQQSAAVARQAGLSLEDTVAVLTLFARNGLRGSDAGTSFRTMLLRLINPTEKAQAIIDKLGLSLRDATGAINLNIFDQFARATKGFTNAQRDQAAAVLFGSDAIRGFLIAVREGNVALNQQIATNNRAGAAQEQAAARTRGLAGAMENLKNQLSNAGTALGGTLAPGLTDLANLMADAVSGTQALVTEVGDLAEAAAKPIDIVVNVIRNVIPGAGGDGAPGDQTREDVRGRLRNIFSIKETAPEFLGDVNALILEAQVAAQEKLDKTPLHLNIVGVPTLDEARTQVRDLISEFNKNRGATELNDTVVALIKLRDEMAKGTFGTKEFAKTLGPFIRQLQDLSGQPIDIPEIKFPANLEAGARSNLSSQGKDAAGAFGGTFLPTMEEVGRQAANAVSTGLVDPGAKAAVAAAAREVAAAAGAAASAASAELDVEFRGGSDAERRRAFERQLAAQRRQVTALTKQGAPQKDIDAAKQAAIETQRKIDQIDEDARQAAESAAQKREKAAQDVAAARSKADQDFLDALAGGRRGNALAQIRASGSERLTDDLAVQVAFAHILEREIAAIDKTVKDAKTRRDQIAERVAELAQTAAEIDRLRTGIANTVKENARKAREAVTQALGKRLQLAELRGGKDEVLAAFTKAIADAKARVRNWKKLGLVQIDEQIALQQLINDRNDFLDGLKKDAKEATGSATTAFDLLSQFSDVFNQKAGNLIGGNQPFAGPTGFTADIAQFLVRRQGAQAGTTAAAAKTPIELNDDRLVRSLDRLTAAVERSSGNTSTAGAVNPVTTNLARNDRRWFMDAANAKAAQEG